MGYSKAFKSLFTGRKLGEVTAMAPRNSVDIQRGGMTMGVEPVSNCRYIRKEGASCSLNNKCKYPNCDEA